MKNTKIKKYSAGDILLQEGEYNKTLHKILSGKVALYLNYGKSNEYLIETLTSSQYFGEISILIQQPCYSTAVAIEDTTILHIASENFEDFIKNNVRNAFLIMNAMAKSLSSLNALLHKIEQGDHPYTHDDTESILSNEELLAVPSHKRLFMDSPAEASDHLQSAPEADIPSEPDEEINALIRHALETSRLTRDRDAMVRNIMQHIADESISSYADYHNILPEVYPDFYLPGHRCYPNITHPEYEEFTFQKEYVCPYCKHTFTGRNIAYTRLTADPVLSDKLRMDFHIFYKNFEAEWYDIVTCPHCYFSSLVDIFVKPSYIQKEKFQEELLQIRASVMLDFSAERTLDFVFMQHYIALACSRAFLSKYRQIDACLWMNLCWLYRSVDDMEMLRLAEDKTIEAYIEMYRNCALSTEQEQRTCLTLAGIYFDREEYISAREWAFAVRINREGKVIYRNMAQGIIDEVRYLLKKEDTKTTSSAK